MTEISQLPAEVNITTTPYDDFSLLLDFNLDLTGYTFTCTLYENSNAHAIAVTNTDLSAGKVTLSIQNTILATIPLGSWRWQFHWVATPGSVDRLVLAGKFTLRSIP